MDFWGKVRRLLGRKTLDVPDNLVEWAQQLMEGHTASPKIVFEHTNLMRTSMTIERMHVALSDEIDIMIEIAEGRDGCHLLAVSDTLLFADVLVFCGEIAFQTYMVDGCFEFKGLSAGKYRIAINEGKTVHWIDHLAVGSP